ncbi:MAG: response regulator [Burkholderiales bacterium]|nr:response regulator [Burkholderiales bacterium]
MKKILIVEDQSDIRRLLRATLEDEGRELREAFDADAGWLQVLEWRPDLVLLDIMMPGSIDGLQLCEHIKGDAATRATKVVLVSARGHRNDLGIGRDAGADDYLSKPFSPLRLIEIVERLSRPGS